MKKFILKSLLFCFLCAAIFGGWSAVLLWAEISAYKREVKIPEGYTLAVCGDSHTEQGLMPAVWPELFNFSLSGMQLDQIQLKIYDLVERNPGQLKTMIVDTSPFNMMSPELSTPLIESKTFGKRFLLHVLRPKENRRSLKGIHVIFRDAILIKRTGKVIKSWRKKRPYQSSIGGVGIATTFLEPGLDPETIETTRECFRTNPDEVMEDIVEKTDKLGGYPKLTAKSENAKILKEIIVFLQEHNIKPIITSTPLHREMLKRISPEAISDYKAVMRAVCSEMGVDYLDYLEVDYPDSYWGDGNHLNNRGAYVFTQKVRADVEAILSAHP